MEQSFSVSSILAPIGTAIITSLLGWFLGELLTDGEYRSEKSVDTESGRVADELSRFIEAIQSLHTKYIETITETNRQFSKARSITSAFNEPFQSINASLKKLEKKDGLANFGDEMLKLIESLRNAAGAAEDTAVFLNQTRVLIDTYEKLIKKIADEK